MVKGERSEPGRPRWRVGERSEPALVAPCGARVRCAAARRSSCGRGPGAQPPENFWDIIPSRVPFYNRVHFFTPVFKILKVVLYIQLCRIITSFVSASCILIFNGCLLPRVQVQLYILAVPKVQVQLYFSCT